MSNENLQEPLKDLKESLEEKLGKINIPQPKEFIRRAAGISQVYGVLFAEDKVM